MARRDRLKQGQEAKERVMARLSAGGGSSASSAPSTRRDRLRPEIVSESASGIDSAVRAIAPDAFDPFKQNETNMTKFKPVPKTVPQATSLPSAGQILKTDHENMAHAGPSFSDKLESRREQRMEDAEGSKIGTIAMRLADPIFTGLDALQIATRPAAKVAEQFYTPGAGLTAIGAGTQAIGNLLGRVAPKIAFGSKALPTVARAAIQEAGVGAPIGAGQVLASNPGASGRDVAEGAAFGAATGAAGGAILSGLGRGIGALVNRMRSNNVPNEAVQEILALPAPRQRGNTNTATSPDVVTPEYTFALPEPRVGEATTARTARQANPFRDQFENLMRTAQKMQADDLFTPGREMEELESLWSQMAGRDGVGLDELIQRAYPSQSNRVTPDLVQRARANQGAREVAGAPIPVKTRAERLINQQGVLGSAESPVQRVGRAPDAATEPQPAPILQRSVTTDTPATPRTSTQGERGFINTLQQSDNVTDDVRRVLNASSERNYDTITNQGTLDQANRRLDRLGVDKAEAQLLNKSKFKAEDVATGMRLIQQLQDAGQVERAVTVAEKVAKQLTEAGQTVQAASIWNRLSPEGALLAAQRRVNRINENLLSSQTPVKITPQQATTIQETAGAMQAAGASRERAGTVMEIMDRARKGETISVDEKQTVADFVADAKRFLKPEDTKPPRPAKPPKEMADRRVRDRVVSFFDNQEQEAIERLKARKGAANSLPLDLLYDYGVIGAAKLARGTVKFADWSEQMIRDFGEEIRPQLRAIYEKSKSELDQGVKKINNQVISRAERIAEGYIKSNEGKLAQTDVDFIRNMAQKVSSLSDVEQRIASQDLQAILNSFEKVGIGRKLAAAQYISMLLNPKTQIRNVVGNELMYRLERMARVFGTPIDMAASKITGTPRQITFKSGPNVWDDFFKTTSDYWGNLAEGAKAGARGISPEGLTTKYEIQGRAFKGKYNPMTYLEKALGASLQGFDYAAYSRAANQRMREMAYLDALNKGIKGNDAIRRHTQTYLANMDEGVQSIARDYGKYATLQDDSGLANLLTKGRQGLNKLSTGMISKDFGAGSILLPFAKTPSNLLLRGMDYSPIGVLRSIGQMVQAVRGSKDLTRGDIIHTFTKGAMGTGMGAIAYWLADKGALFGKSDKDTDTRKLQQSAGMKDFQVNGSALMRMIDALGTGGDIDAAAKIKPGDTLWTYNWAQPTATPIAIASNIYKGKEEGKDALSTAGSAAAAGVGTLLDSSLLSGLTDAFKVPTGTENVWKAIATNIIRDIPSQFVPSLLRQFNTVFDGEVKETYTPDSLRRITASAESNIPGLSQKMPQKVSTLGEPQTKPNSIFDVFFSPADRTKYTPTKEANLVLDLLSETGDTKLAPRAVAKYLTGTDTKTNEKVKIDLTPQQYTELQRVVGLETAKRLGKINPNLSTDEKAALVIKAFDEAGKIGRDMMKKQLGIKITR